MKRTLMQIYIKDSKRAVPFYQKAFNAPIVSSYLNDDGTYFHSELDIGGQILSVAEAGSIYENSPERLTGNIMQFCLEFGAEGREQLEQAYSVLKEGADISIPLGPCEFSQLMTDLIDCFGVRWCMYI